jgi:hypothetical protein
MHPPAQTRARHAPPPTQTRCGARTGAPHQPAHAARRPPAPAAQPAKGDGDARQSKGDALGVWRGAGSTVEDTDSWETADEPASGPKRRWLPTQTTCYSTTPHSCPVRQAGSAAANTAAAFSPKAPHRTRVQRAGRQRGGQHPPCCPALRAPGSDTPSAGPPGTPAARCRQARQGRRRAGGARDR